MSKLNLRKERSAYASGKIVGEKNDCAVRAVAVATGRPYEEVHAIFAKLGRATGKRTKGSVTIAVMEFVGYATFYDMVAERGYHLTLHKFLERYPTGSYVVRKKGHAFAIVDGVVHDWGDTSGARTKITCAWKVK